MGIEPTHVGITTRGLTTWLQTPYKNTLDLQLLVVINLLLTFTDPASSLECFYIANSLQVGFEPTFAPDSGDFLAN